MVKPAIKPKVLQEEVKYREELLPDVKGIINKNLLCTSCNCSVRQLVQKGKPRSHPFLDTLLCEKCHQFYGDGEFSVDEDGSDKYCRWCGQGGTLYLCCKCSAGFCKKCIKRNLPRAVLKEVEADDWECFLCNLKPLYELRAYSWAAQKYAKSNQKEKSDSTGKKRKCKRDASEDEDEASDVKSASKKKKKDLDSSAKKKKLKKDFSEDEGEASDDKSSIKKNKTSEDDESDQSSKRKPRRNDRKTNLDEETDEALIKKQSLRKKQLKLARSQMNNTLQDLIKLADIAKNKASAFNKKKVTVVNICDVDTFRASSETVTNMLQSLEDMAKSLRLNFVDFVSNWETTVKEMDQEDTNGVQETEKDETIEKPEDDTKKTEGSDTEIDAGVVKNEEDSPLKGAIYDDAPKEDETCEKKAETIDSENNDTSNEKAEPNESEKNATTENDTSMEREEEKPN